MKLHYSKHQDPLKITDPNVKQCKEAYKQTVKEILEYGDQTDKENVIRTRATVMFLDPEDPRRGTYNAALQSKERITLHRINCRRRPNDFCSAFCYNSWGKKYYQLSGQQKRLVESALATTGIVPRFLKDPSGKGKVPFKVDEAAVCNSLGPH